MTEINDWVGALRASHERLSAVLRALDTDQLESRSYDSEWSIADVASHLGSQAELFSRFLDSGLTGEDLPDGDQMAEVWDRWNAKTPDAQIQDSIAANEGLISRFEQLPEEQRTAFALSLFGMELDLSGLVALRLSEHAVHTWDVAVALDPTTLVAAGAVELLIDSLPAMASQVGKPTDEARVVSIETVDPTRSLVLTTGPGSVDLSTGDDLPGATRLRISAEGLLRLVYGRLDPEHPPADVSETWLLTELRPVFPGL